MSADQAKSGAKGTEEKDTGLTRRKFLVGAGVSVAGALVMNQMTPHELKAVEPPKKWDKETEVLIVGTGYSGLTAAIEAFDAGSKVTIIEKNPVIGGNSAIASGAYNAVDPGRQGKQGIKDSIDLHYKQTLEGGDYRGDPEKVRFLVENALGGLQWLEKMGVEFEPTVYTVVGALHPRSHDPVKKGRGGAIVQSLKAQVDKRGIPIFFNNKMVAVVREKILSGPVMGLVVNQRGKDYYFKASKAVILASGGFSADVPMRSKYDPRLDKEVPTTNVSTATGEAIIASQDEGADVTGMDYIQLLIACNYYTKKYGSLTNLGIDSAIFVNTEGKRFVAEDARRDVMAEAVLKQPKKVLLWIADEKCTKRFDPGSTEKIIKDGLSFRARTLEDLAKILKEKFAIPEATFLATVKKYNEMVRKGKDEEFGKKAANLKPIEQPPFYASPTQAGVHHTMGGIRTKGTTCEVLDRHGNLIPRFYAAGEVTSGVHGANRLGGNATADCIVFGRISGINAAKQKPWV
ncbi:MAG: Urocanate reductase precursor [Syntrophorhabdus sp. PtaU1.Bin153]|nr:MAG: Urocanate reductase precursor [Syntrophorhabdus sp. PtaU1.Bin153]